MLKYIIKDLKETLTYLPYGIMAGAVVGLLLNGLNTLCLHPEGISG